MPDEAPSSKPIRVALVEDDDLFRDLLQQTLGQRDEIHVVASFARGDDAMRSIPRLGLDVAILDISLADKINGIQLGLRLRQQLPNLGIVILSNHNKASVLQYIPEDSISGWSYLTKGAVHDVETLLRAIKSTAIGLVVFNPEQSNHQTRKSGKLARLSDREFEVLELMVQGYSNRGIAERLRLSEKTIENYISPIYAKLTDQSVSSLHPRVQSVLIYLSEISSTKEITWDFTEHV